MENEAYRFGPYRLEAVKQLLWRGEEAIRIRPREFDTMHALAKRQGEPVESQILINEIWRGTTVSANNLSQQIKSLRKILGKDEAGQDYIRNVS